MISLNEARRIIGSLVSPRPTEAVPLSAACGRVLATPVSADRPYPDGDRSQMDGYVVGEEATAPGRYRVVGEIAAGDLPSRVLLSGEAMRILTGAMVPEGGTRVVRQEDTVKEGEFICIERFGESRFVRRHGCEAQKDQVLLPAGARLGASEIAILAQVGAVDPKVIGWPRVHHVATGSELVAPAADPKRGQIRDTNSLLLRSLCLETGVASFGSCRSDDDPAALLEAATTEADLLLISGGAGAGAHDHGASTLRQLGYTIHFDRVNLRPGKPLTFATRGSQAAFVIPGNPVSHFICFHLAVKLALQMASGLRPDWPVVWLEMVGGSVLEPDPRETWWPARTLAVDGNLAVSPLHWTSSGHAFALVGVNALILVNEASPAHGRALTMLLGPPASS